MPTVKIPGLNPATTIGADDLIHIRKDDGDYRISRNAFKATLGMTGDEVALTAPSNIPSATNIQNLANYVNTIPDDFINKGVIAVCKTVSDMMSSSILLVNGKSITSSEIVGFVNTGAIIKTTQHNATTKKGGADYELINSAEAASRGLTSNSYTCIPLFGGSTYFAALMHNGVVPMSKVGGSQAAYVHLNSANEVRKILFDQDLVLTANQAFSKPVEFCGGVISGAFTATFSSLIDAPREQIFGSTVTAVAANGYQTSYSYPEWWLLESDADETVAIQKAANFLIPTGGHVSLKPLYRYTINSERVSWAGDTHVDSYGVKIDLGTGPITVGGDSDSVRELAELEVTGSGLGLWFLSGALFTSGMLVNTLLFGPDSTAGNETCVGVRFSDAWGMGFKNITQRGFETSICCQFYNYNLWTEGWILDNCVFRRGRILVDFSRSDHEGNTGTDSFAWGNVKNVNMSVGNGGLGYGSARAFNILDPQGANVYGITIESLVLFSELSGNIQFFRVQGEGNILTGQANLSIDGFINQSATDHQILYQRDGGYINLQGRFIHQQGSSVRPGDTWRALCFTEPFNVTPGRRCPCSYVGAVVRSGGTVDIGDDGSFVYQLNAAAVYRIRLQAKAEINYFTTEYVVTTYDANLLASVDLIGGAEHPNVKCQVFGGGTGHAYQLSDGGKIDIILDNSAPGPEDIVWHLDVEQIA
jgi:hypothetical protein